MANVEADESLTNVEAPPFTESVVTPPSLGSQSTQTKPPVQVRQPVGTFVSTDKGIQAQTVTIPADPAQLSIWAKGNPVNALTWLANFWLRIIKKALSIGARIITAQSIKIPVSDSSTSGLEQSSLETQSGLDKHEEGNKSGTTPVDVR